MVKPQKKKKPRIRQRKLRRKIGSRTYKNYTDEMLGIACHAVQSQQISSRDAEKQFGIPRRTILNKIKSKHTNPVGRPTALTPTEEKNILKVLQAAGDFGSPLTKLDLKLVVHEYLKKNSRDHIFKHEIPGDAWVDGFLARHANELTVRTTQNITKARAAKGPQEIAEYFENLGTTLKDIPPQNIINFDETNLSDDPGSTRGIFRRGIKYPERIVNFTKGNISLMFTATASGECLPLYVVYKATNLYSEWISGGPPETRYNCTKSGWFDSAMFEDYFEKIIVPWAVITPGTKVAICDNLSSHLSIKVIELCDQNNIHFVFIPPRSTHLTQPLDVAFFAPLKKAWRKILYQYKLKNPDQNSLNKKHFPKLLTALLDEIQLKQSRIIQSGFRASGIYPFNPQEVLKKMPEMQEEVLAYGIDQTLLDYLKETRSPKPMQVKRNKKITCDPGQSVTVSDFIEANSADDGNKKSKKGKVKSKKEKAQHLDERTGYFIDPPSNSERNDHGKAKLKSKKEKVQYLDEQTGNFIDPVDNETNYHENFYLETDLETYDMAEYDKRSSPESLKKLCTDMINVNLSLSLVHNSRASTAADHFYLVKTSAPTNSKKRDKPKIKILSDVIVKAGNQRSDVMILKEVSNKIENKPFVAINTNKLPECLQKKKKVSKNIKPECSNKGKKQSKAKNDLRRKKGKRRRKIGYDSSSISTDTEVVTVDTDESNYETIEDYYITECLREQGEEKENLDLADIPFGLHDIEFFTENQEKLNENDWIVAQFNTKKSVKHFVGKVTSIKNKQPTVKFLRKVKESKYDKGTAFTYPTVDDICIMEHIEDVITVLPQPYITRRGQLIFDVDFSSFNIQ